MHKKTALVVMAAVSIVATGVLLGAATTVPATTTFRDASSDRIESDASVSLSSSYQDGFDCVKSEVSGNGFFFRSRSYSCTTATPWLATRSVTLDFRQPVGEVCPSPSIVTDAYAGGTLDICGAQLVSDVRILAGGLFGSVALTKGTGVMLVFSNPTNFSGPGGFELDFEQNVGVTAMSSMTRQLIAPATAIAELYQKVPPSGKKISLGRYYMPFSLTVAKLY